MRSSTKSALITALYIIFVIATTYDAFAQQTNSITQKDIKGADTVFFELKLNADRYIYRHGGTTKRQISSLRN